MATIDFSLDQRVKKTFVPLVSQQRHLRHIKRIAARNINVLTDEPTVKSGDQSLGYRFTIHDIDEELLYKSEAIFSTSPEWKTFQSSSFRCPAMSELIVRLYFCPTINDDLCETNDQIDSKCVFKLFLEWKIHLNGLVFIGEEIPKDNRFKENTVILGLMEGFYTSLDSIASDELLNQFPLRQQTISVSDISNCRTTYCLNVLYRIEMMQRVINQTVVLVNSSRTKLEEKLSQMLDTSDLQSRVELMEVRVKSLQNKLFLSKQKLNTSRENRNSAENDICEKGIDMLNKIQNLKQQKDKLIHNRKKLGETKERLTKTKADLMLRRKQLMTDISAIYPLVPFPDGNGGYSICGVHLPNSECLDGHDDIMISIAIGYVTHILVMISRLLDVTLRYQLIYFGSRSSVVDHLNDKISENDRIFPLHSKSGKDKMHFKYGLFLVNKNIAQLRHYLGLHTRDLSATLPNLYSLLKERLVFLNEDLKSVEHNSRNNGMPTTSCNSFNANHFGHIDDYLRREMEVMRNLQELQEAGPSKANSIRLRNLSIVSNNSIRVVNENRSITRSLDKGLNEIVGHSSTKSNNESVSSSISSDSHIIPKHLLNSNQIHHNLSESDFKKLKESNKLSIKTDKQLKWCEPSDDDIPNGVNCNHASSSDSSPQTHIWTDTNFHYNSDKHSDNN